VTRWPRRNSVPQPGSKGGLAWARLWKTLVSLTKPRGYRTASQAKLRKKTRAGFPQAERAVENPCIGIRALE
jgi:hypothetical protein